jgi:outer membrane biosynthesis protein TonB
MVSSGNSEIDAVILETLKKWRFEPEVREGKPVNSRFRARVEIIPS